MTGQLEQLLDHLEAAWDSAADIPAVQLPDGLPYLLWKIGTFVEQERPGLVERFTARRLGERS